MLVEKIVFEWLLSCGEVGWLLFLWWLWWWKCGVGLWWFLEELDDVLGSDVVGLEFVFVRILLEFMKDVFVVEFVVVELVFGDVLGVCMFVIFICIFMLVSLNCGLVLLFVCF